jgi:hypothetical protein
MKKLLTLWFLFASFSQAQGVIPQFIEHFDSVTAPTLPHGWTSTSNRAGPGDFVTSTSSPHSSPNAVLSTNSTISQTLTSALFDFAGCSPVKLEFYSARSSSHIAGLLVEVSTDGGGAFPIVLGDTIRNPGTSSYVLSSLPLPSSLAGQSQVRIRWRLIAAPTGTTGTFRLDDVSITTKFSFDLALMNLEFQNPISGDSPSSGQEVTLKATVKNVGSQPVSSYSVQFFRDLNYNSIAEQGERFTDVNGPGLLPSDSTVILGSSPPSYAGDNHFIAVISSLNDSNPSNDTASIVMTVGGNPRALVVNEIMFDPLIGQNEWIEFYNRGSTPLDIARWKFSDRPTAGGSNSFIITNNSAIIQSGDFVVVSADSSIFSQFSYLESSSQATHLFILNRAGGFGLNNDGDDIVLRDAVGRTIDSVSYSASWHNPDISDAKGRSLERINPEIASNDRRNWSTSPSPTGGTPGRTNALYTTVLPTGASISIHPNPFSPDGDGFEDFCVVQYNLPLMTSIIRITIFDIKGRMVRTLANCELSGSHGEIVWDGLDDTKQRVRIGPYVVFIEAIDQQGGILATARAVAVVATKL